MEIKYLWDSNTIVYYFQKQFPPSAELFIDNIPTAETSAISVITELELLSWRTADPKDLQTIQNFIAESLIIELEPSIKIKTVELRRNYRIKLPDAIIAATAIVLNLTLLTRNISDFTNIKGLKLINPWDK